MSFNKKLSYPLSVQSISFQNILKWLFVSTFFLSFPILINAKSPNLTKKELSVPPQRIIRTCCGFGVEIGFVAVPFARKTDITSIETMGTHQYMGHRTEKNGIVYTHRGGFIDLGHLRDCADWTAYLYDLIKASQTDASLTHIDLRNEGGSKSLTLKTPDNYTENEIIALAGKISYDMSVWHEISTWFGARYVPLVPERFSSFSPEDMYSNLMGVHLGMRAIKSELPYNEAMTDELFKMLDSLEVVQTENETFDAMLSVNQVWYTNSKRYPSNKVTLKRYLDLDSYLIPWLVPGTESTLPPYPLKKPDSLLADYYELALKLNHRFPIDSVLGEKGNRVITQNDFDAFISFIQKEWIKEAQKPQETAEKKNKKEKKTKAEK